MDDAALLPAVGAYVHALCKVIWACRQLEGVVRLLEAAVATLLDCSEDNANSLGAVEGLEDHWRHLQAAAAAAGGRQLITPCFYGLPFRQLGETLLSVVAPDWRHLLSPRQDEALFLRFFRQAPAEAVLDVLVTHLASVEPPSQAAGRGRPAVTAVSADVACELLAERFASPGSCGLQQLLDLVAGGDKVLGGDDASSGSSGGSSGSSGSSTLAAGGFGASHHQQQQQRQQQQGGQEQAVDALAASLASIPERAAACDAPQLLPEAFVPLLVAQLLPWLQRLQAGQGAQEATEGMPGAVGGPEWTRGLSFAADLVSRLCKRGHAPQVAAALWGGIRPAVRQQVAGARGSANSAAPQSGGIRSSDSGSGSGRDGMLAAATSLVGGMEGAGALEKLVEALLRLLASDAAAAEAAGAPAGAQHAPAPAGPSGSKSSDSTGTAGALIAAAAAAAAATPSQQGASWSAGVPDEVAVAVLCTLLPNVMWASRPGLRYALGDKLLTQRALPAAALRWVVRYIDAVGGGGGSCDAPAGSGGGEPGGAAEQGHSAASPAPSAKARGTLPASDALADVACHLARVWGDPTTLQSLPPRRQACLTAALVEALGRLGAARFQRHPGLLPAVLQGVGARLDSPAVAVRRQAMRVAHRMSQLLDPSKPPLFEEDRPWELLAEEEWEEGSSQPAGATQAPQAGRRAAATGRRPGTAAHGAGRPAAGVRSATAEASQEGEGGLEWPLTETDSDDEGLAGSGSEDDLQPYDLAESDEEDVAKSGLQLRDLTRMLLNGEKDWRGQLRALRCAEALIRAAPDELEHYAVPLARALLHSPIPKWAVEEAKDGEEAADMQRFRSLVAITVESPARSGLVLASELYSPSLDMHQRDLLLTTLSTAAQELAHPGSFLQPLPGMTAPSGSCAAAAALPSGGAKPAQFRVVGGSTGPAGVGAAAPAVAAAAGGGGAAAPRPGAGEEPLRVGKVTRVSERSLASLKARSAAPAPTFVSRFPAVALPWAAALLRECDRQNQGIDLFGRDAFLLGRLLVTLGTFLECAAQSPEALPLAAGVVELVRSPRVHTHPEPFVRRAALLATSQVMTALPPARLSSAMLAAAGTAVGAAAADAQDAALVARLDWVRTWTESVAAEDGDEGCRKMAAACRQLQSSLAAGAMAALDAAEGLGAGAGQQGLLPMPQPGVRVSVPQLEQLRLR